MSKLFKILASAFGGYSQIPYATIGAAIYGRCNNNGAAGAAELSAVMAEIVERYDDDESAPAAEWTVPVIAAIKAGYAAAWQEGSAAPRAL